MTPEERAFMEMPEAGQQEGTLTDEERAFMAMPEPSQPQPSAARTPEEEEFMRMGEDPAQAPQTTWLGDIGRAMFGAIGQAAEADTARRRDEDLRRLVAMAQLGSTDEAIVTATMAIMPEWKFREPVQVDIARTQARRHAQRNPQQGQQWLQIAEILDAQVQGRDPATVPSLPHGTAPPGGWVAPAQGLAPEGVPATEPWQAAGLKEPLLRRILKTEGGEMRGLGGMATQAFQAAGETATGMQEDLVRTFSALPALGAQLGLPSAQDYQVTRGPSGEYEYAHGAQRGGGFVRDIGRAVNMVTGLDDAQRAIGMEPMLASGPPTEFVESLTPLAEMIQEGASESLARTMADIVNLQTGGIGGFQQLTSHPLESVTNAQLGLLGAGGVAKLAGAAAKVPGAVRAGLGAGERGGRIAAINEALAKGGPNILERAGTTLDRAATSIDPIMGPLRAAKNVAGKAIGLAGQLTAGKGPEAMAAWQRFWAHPDELEKVIVRDAAGNETNLMAALDASDAELAARVRGLIDELGTIPDEMIPRIEELLRRLDAEGHQFWVRAPETPMETPPAQPATAWVPEDQLPSEIRRIVERFREPGAEGQWFVTTRSGGDEWFTTSKGARRVRPEDTKAVFQAEAGIPPARGTAPTVPAAAAPEGVPPPETPPAPASAAEPIAPPEVLAWAREEVERHGDAMRQGAWSVSQREHGGTTWELRYRDGEFGLASVPPAQPAMRTGGLTRAERAERALSGDADAAAGLTDEMRMEVLQRAKDGIAAQKQLLGGLLKEDPSKLMAAMGRTNLKPEAARSLGKLLEERQRLLGEMAEIDRLQAATDAAQQAWISGKSAAAAGAFEAAQQAAAAGVVKAPKVKAALRLNERQTRAFRKTVREGLDRDAKLVDEAAKRMKATRRPQAKPAATGAIPETPPDDMVIDAAFGEARNAPPRTTRPSQATGMPEWVTLDDIMTANGIKRVSNAKGGFSRVPMTPEEIAAARIARPGFYDWVNEWATPEYLARADLEGVYSVNMPGREPVTVEALAASAVRTRFLRSMGESIELGLLPRETGYQWISEYFPDLYRQYEAAFTETLGTPPAKNVVAGIREREIIGDRLRYGKHKSESIETRTGKGLIRNARAVAAKGLSQIYHDIESAKLFRKLRGFKYRDGSAFATAQKDALNTVQLKSSKGTFTRGGAKGYGDLEGMWVRPEVAQQLKALRRIPGTAERWYKKVLNAWKYGMTVLNPATHTRNIVGNVVLADMSGLNPFTSQAAAGSLRGLWRDLRAQSGRSFERYLRAGGRKGDWVNELRGELKALGKEDPGAGYLRSEGNLVDGALNHADFVVRLGEHGRRGLARAGQTAAWQKTAGAVRWVDRKMAAAYQMEDEFFRFWKFRQVDMLLEEFRKTGHITREMREVLGDDLEALLKATGDDQLRLIMKQAHRVSFDYSKHSKAVEWGKTGWSPFLQFTANALPEMGRFLAKHPLKAQFYRQMFDSLEMYTAFGGERPSEQELLEMEMARAGLPPWSRVGALFRGKRLVDIEGGGQSEQFEFWNAQYYSPAGNLISGGHLLDPSAPTFFGGFSNPMVTIPTSLVMNTDPQTGKHIVPEGKPGLLSSGSFGSEWLDWKWPYVLRNTLPPIVPGGRLWQKGMAALQGQGDYRDRLRTGGEFAADAIAGFRTDLVDAQDAASALAPELDEKMDQVDRMQDILEMKGKAGPEEEYDEQRAAIEELFRRQMDAVRRRAQEAASLLGAVKR